MRFPFLIERRPVQHAGRRYLCGPPTIATVLLFVEHYGTELALLADPEAKMPNEPELLLPFLAHGPRAAEVLATCCQLHAAAPGEFEQLVGQDKDLSIRLATEVLQLVDVQRVVGAMPVAEANAALKGSAAPAADVVPGVSNLVLGVALVARFFGVPPHQVMAWPFEEFLEVTENVLPLLDDHVQPPGRMATVEELASIPGAGVHKVQA